MDDLAVSITLFSSLYASDYSFLGYLLVISLSNHLSGLALDYWKCTYLCVGCDYSIHTLQHSSPSQPGSVHTIFRSYPSCKPSFWQRSSNFFGEAGA